MTLALLMSDVVFRMTALTGVGLVKQSLLVLLSLCAHAQGIRLLGSSTLGKDPQTVNRLNGESFQQDALVTHGGYQYAVFYINDVSNSSIRHPSVSRRALAGGLSNTPSRWDSFVLEDYAQTEDDGHDVITLGVSRGDGTLHIGFDQHDNPLNYRISKSGVATNPLSTPWTPDIFGPTLNYLPGLESLDRSVYFINVTYPRFLSIPRTTDRSSTTDADLLLELRVGRSGLGDDWLYQYVPGSGWKQIGRYLEGVNNNAYINGLDFDSEGNLVTTWTYRDYVNDTGQDVAVEAGPNGPENNHDMDFAFSQDLGATWFNNWNQPISNVSNYEPILPNSAGITVFSIPKYGGILNQESQTVDPEGRVHVLNRENTTGVERWYHYWRAPGPTHFWTRSPLPLPPALKTINNITNTPTVIGKRGKLFSPPLRGSTSISSFKSQKSVIYAILPSNVPNSTAFSILSSTASSDFNEWNAVWEAESGCGWEPLFDRYRLTDPDEDGVLSLYVVDDGEVKVLDFEL